MTNTEIVNITGYKFIALKRLHEIIQLIKQSIDAALIKGTVFVSAEGIKVNLAGKRCPIEYFCSCLQDDSRFQDIQFHRSYSREIPFQKLVIKVKKELITTKQDLQPIANQQYRIAAKQLKNWLDEKKDFVLLDTRNRYEYHIGHFQNAVTLPLQFFTQFRSVINQVANINKDKPIVMYCTGGIRCEKALPQMLQAGYSQVYQLQGGILEYFSQCGGVHYEGECFVFDERITVDPNLQVSGAKLCKNCQYPFPKSQLIDNHSQSKMLCQACHNQLK